VPYSRPVASRRRRLRSLVLPRSSQPERAAVPPLLAVAGRILDASPHLLVLETVDVPARELRLPMTGSTQIWYGEQADLGALMPGHETIVRLVPGGLTADRIWVDIRRVTGVIVDRGHESVEVDMGPHRGRAHVLLPARTFGRVLVRHPNFEPGFLIDVIAVAGPRGLVAMAPGTSQPGYRATDPPTPRAPSTTGPAARTVSGTATWFPADRPHGAAYPGLDPEGDSGGCTERPAGCLPLPYLSIGSDLQVRNECDGRAGTVPVIECGCMAARFCDRCVTCGTSARGRIVELTPLSFVELGGELEKGCFNATLTVGV
jgi:hypothetical protein